MKREEMLNLWVNWSKWSDHIWAHYQRPKQQNSFDNWSIYFLIWNQQLVSKSISVKNVSNGQDKKKEIILDKDRAFFEFVTSGVSKQKILTSNSLQAPISIRSQTYVAVL